MKKFTNFITRGMGGRRIILILILIEVLIIIFLGGQIKIRTESLIIAPLAKDFVIWPEGELKYYFEYKPNVIIPDKQDWLPYVPKYSINSDGLNDRFDYSLEKKSNVFRIVTIGDSYTFGYMVNTPDNYPEQLEEMVNNQCKGERRIEVINLGMPGYDMQYSVKRYMRKGRQYNPDLVLFFVKKDDFMDIAEFTTPRKTFYSQNPDADELKRFTDQGFSYFEVYKAMNELQDKWGKEKVLEFGKGQLNNLTEFYKNDLVLFTYKNTDKDLLNAMDDFTKNKPKAHVSSELSYVDKTEGLHFPDGHPNKEGYTVIVNEMINYLKTNNLIPCS